MAGSYPFLQLGPATYQASVTVTGGQLVQPDTATGKEKLVKPATAGSKTVLGMAEVDAAPAGSGSNLNYATNQPDVSVVYGPADVYLTASADITFGALVAAGANGTVVPAGSSTFDQIVGRCTDPKGILSGKVGRVRLGAI